MDNPRTVPTSRPQLWKGLLLAGGLFALLLGGALLSSAGIADARGRWGHGHHHNPEAVRERVAFAAEWVLALADATEAQEEEIQGILDQTLRDLFELRGEWGHEELHEEALAQLTAETIDRDALEEIRKKKLQVIDAASVRIADAIASIGEVLTQEQRLELAAQAGRFHRFR